MLQKNLVLLLIKLSLIILFNSCNSKAELLCDFTEIQGEIIKFDLPHNNPNQIYNEKKTRLIRNYINDKYNVNNVTEKSLKLYFLDNLNIFFRFDLISNNCNDISILGIINLHNDVLCINIKNQSDGLFKWEFDKLNPVIYFKYFHTKTVFNTYKVDFNFKNNETILLSDDSLTRWDNGTD